VVEHRFKVDDDDLGPGVHDDKRVRAVGGIGRGRTTALVDGGLWYGDQRPALSPDPWC
jgi:hypothetical protein